MSIYAQRVEVLIELIAEIGMEAFTSKTGITASELSNMRRKPDDARFRLSAPKARRLEAKLGLVSGDLDKRAPSSRVELFIAPLENALIQLERRNGFQITDNAADSLLEDGGIIIALKDMVLSPHLNKGDLVVCQRTNTFDGEGIYLVEFRTGLAFRYASISVKEDHIRLSGMPEFVEDACLKSDEITFRAKVSRGFRRVAI